MEDTSLNTGAPAAPAAPSTAAPAAPAAPSTAAPEVPAAPAVGGSPLPPPTPGVIDPPTPPAPPTPPVNPPTAPGPVPTAPGVPTGGVATAVAKDGEPRKRYRGKIVVKEEPRTVEKRTFQHVYLEDGQELDLTEVEYRTEVHISYPPNA